MGFPATSISGFAVCSVSGFSRSAVPPARTMALITHTFRMLSATISGSPLYICTLPVACILSPFFIFSLPNETIFVPLTIIRVVSLTVLTSSTMPPMVTIFPGSFSPIVPTAGGTIGEKDAGKIVTIGGIVEEVKTVSDTTLMIVNGTKIVSFGNENIKKGERIQATGRVQIYNGEPEIVADSIRKV